MKPQPSEVSLAQTLRRYSLILAMESLLIASPASAIPFQMIVEVTPQFGNEIFLLEYNSLGDVISASGTTTATAHNLPDTYNARGFAYDGNQYHMLVESDPGAGNTLFLYSYDTLADFIAGNFTAQPTNHGFQTSADVSGFTYDGNQFHMLVEVTPQFGNELFVLTYDSIADLINANATTALTQHNFQTSADAHGFTFDGDEFHMLVEVTPQFGNELFVLTYDSLASVISASETTQLTQHSFQTSADAAGFNALIDFGTVPNPATLGLFGIGIAGLGWLRRKKA